LRAKAADERGNGNQPDPYKNNIAGFSQVLIFSEEGDDEQAKPDDRPDNWEMIQ
jgi:hypothetical protein